MTSTKKPIISKESIEKNKKLKTIHDMYRELDRESINRDDNVKSYKNKIIDDVFENGDDYVKEMNENKKELENNRILLINFIVSNYKNQSPEELDNFSYEDLINYLSYLKEENNIFKKILKFLNLIK